LPPSTWQDRNVKKGCSKGKNCQGDLQQENCLGSWIKGMIKNTGKDWIETGEDGKKVSGRRID